MKPLFPLALLAALTACGSDDPKGEPSPEANAATAPADQPTLTAAVRDAPRAKAAVVLDADGFSADGTALKFGSARAAVDAAAGKALALAAAKSANGECGAGPMTFSDYGPLKLAFLDDKLAGWYLAKGPGDIVTVDGIKPGATMPALTAERQVTAVEGSTLDGEFQYVSATGGMITGFYAGDLRSGTIVALAAGMNCFFR